MSTSDVASFCCPICFEPMKNRIYLCTGGHSICDLCIKNLKNCPRCRAPMTETRNYQLEGVIEGIEKCMKLACFYKLSGCTYLLSLAEKENHESECRYRKFYCEGKKFAKWPCNWTGKYEEIEKHFRQNHGNQVSMQFKTEASMEINLKSDYNDMQLIPFFQKHLFYYKHRVDVKLEKVYFCFQFVGTKSGAKNFYYEFEVNNNSVRKYKVTEICENDTTDVETIFENERCVVLSFKQIKNMLSENGELSFKFRIMSARQPKTSK